MEKDYGHLEPLVLKVAEAIWQAESIRVGRGPRLTKWKDESEQTHNQYRPLACAALDVMFGFNKQ